MKRKQHKYEVPGDKWYDWKNVRRPERTAHLTEEEMEVAFQENLKGHVHEWYQRGNEIACDMGSSVHGKRIGTGVRLAGTTPDGEPVLVPIGPILRSEV